MQAHRDTIDYMYSDNPQVLKDYADFAGVSEAMARRVRDDFFKITGCCRTISKASTR